MARPRPWLVEIAACGIWLDFRFHRFHKTRERERDREETKDTKAASLSREPRAEKGTRDKKKRGLGVGVHIGATRSLFEATPHASPAAIYTPPRPFSLKKENSGSRVRERPSGQTVDRFGFGACLLSLSSL